MASISTNVAGFRRVLFTFAGKRRTVYLGDVSAKAAQTFRIRVEGVLERVGLNQPLDPQSVEWLDGLPDDQYGKLAAIGLVKARGERTAATLTTFVEAHLAGRHDLKPRTLTGIRYALRYLARYFGAEKSMGDVSEGDCDTFRLFLRGECDLAENTTRKILSRARQLFRVALRHRLIPSNPFASLKSISSLGRSDRHYFISQADTAKLIEAAGDLEWKVIIALARYGGLRCPSEILTLTWDDVNWEKQLVTVRVPKLEHIEGKAERTIPLFAELKPWLDAAWVAAPERAMHVITRYRDTNSNLRTQLLRIIKRAGLKQWPRLFVNLRSSRQTELSESYPQHVVCAWLGNSERIAMKHYLQVRPEDIERAAREGATTRKTTRTTANQSEPEGKKKTASIEPAAVFSGVPRQCAPYREDKYSRQESEHSADSPGNSQDLKRDDAQNDALPLDLLRVVEAWPVLADADRAAILAVINAATSTEVTAEGAIVDSGPPDATRTGKGSR